MAKRDKTIFDIAEALNISASTVSRALQGSTLVNYKTREKVEQMAKEMDYQQNVMASNLRKSKSNTIGIIIPRINRNFFSQVISGIEDTARKNGYHILIGQSLELPELEKELLDTFFSARVDGIVASCTMHTTDFSPFLKVRAKGTPIILFDRSFRSDDIMTIEGDDFSGGFMATEHLIQQGCKRVAYIGGLMTNRIYQERYRGYLAALVQYEHSYVAELVKKNGLTATEGVEAIKTLWSLNARPDGVFCGNDTTAIAVLQYLKSIGVHVPYEIAIMGYSNEPVSAIVSPSISTIDQGAYKMGIAVMGQMNILLEADEETIVQETLVLPVQLLVRESSMKQAI
jgi:LacI family transcriptional regulator